MANRILVATLYMGSSSTPLLNISPDTLETHQSQDNIYLVVKKDSSVPDGPSNSISCSLNWNEGSNPFSSGPSFPTSLDTPTLMGALNSGTSNEEYTLSVTYNGNAFVEDPRMKINS